MKGPEPVSLGVGKNSAPPASWLLNLKTRFSSGILLWILRADTDQFRTGWFLESVISAALIVLVVRTRRPFLESRPGKSLFLAIVLIASGTALFPYTPLAAPFGFRPLPLFFFSAMGMIVALYMIAAEMAKGYFYRKVKF